MSNTYRVTSGIQPSKGRSKNMVFVLLLLFGANLHKCSRRSTVGEDIGTFLVPCGILSKGWEKLHRANKSENFSLNEYEGVAYVALPSFHKIEGFIVEESKYGEGNIQTDNRIFSTSLKGNDDQPLLPSFEILLLC